MLEVSSGGLLTSDVSVNGNGVLKGDGGINDGNVTLNGGMLAPGNSPGTMTVLGDLFLIDGTVELEIGPGLSDKLIIGDDVLFGENVLFDLTEMFDITGSALFDSGFSLADSVNITGIDAGTSLLITLFEQQFTYEASPVPVPAPVWLLGSGLLALVGTARRKKAA